MYLSLSLYIYIYIYICLSEAMGEGRRHSDVSLQQHSAGRVKVALLSQAPLLKGGGPLLIQFAPLVPLSFSIQYRRPTHRLSLSQEPRTNTCPGIRGAPLCWSCKGRAMNCPALMVAAQATRMKVPCR